MNTLAKKLIGIVVIFILLLTGVASKGRESYSAIAALREKKAVVAGETINSVNHNISYEKICTTRMISGGRESIINALRHFSRQIFHGMIDSITLEAILPYLLFYFISISDILWKVLDIMPEVLRYIHNQDGEKNRVLHVIS